MKNTVPEVTTLWRDTNVYYYYYYYYNIMWKLKMKLKLMNLTNHI